MFVAVAPGCDSGAGDDQPGDLARMEIRLKRTDSQIIVSTGAIEFSADAPTGEAASVDTLKFTRGVDYKAEIRLYDDSGNIITGDIRERPEEHQIFLNLSGTDGVSLSITDSEDSYGVDEFGDNLPVGLKFDLNTSLGFRESSGELNIQLVEFPPETKNGVNTEGGNILVDAELPVVVDRIRPSPSDLPPITRAVINIESDTGPSLELIAENPNGLENGTAVVDTLRLPDDHTYSLSIRLFNDDAGEELTEIIQNDSEFYLFDYGFLQNDRMTLDRDSEDRTFGQSAILNLNGVQAFGDADIKLFVFDPNFGHMKGTMSEGREIMNYTIAVRIGF